MINLLPSTSTSILTTKGAGSSIITSTYVSTSLHSIWCHIPEDRYFNIHHHENLIMNTHLPNQRCQTKKKKDTIHIHKFWGLVLPSGKKIAWGPLVIITLEVVPFCTGPSASSCKKSYFVMMFSTAYDSASIASIMST
jgi:hypothetical protein